jgi:hypothetical protein
MGAYEREQYHADQFAASLGLSVSPVKRESPDFLLIVEGRDVGLELTRIYGPADPGALPVQQTDGLLSKAIEDARSRFREAGGPALYLTFTTSKHPPTTKSEARDLADRLLGLLLDGAGWQRPFSSEESASISEIASIRAYPSVDGKDELWSHGRGTWMKQLGFEVLQDAISGKDKLLPKYRLAFNELWLVLIRDFFERGHFYEVTQAALDHEYQSGFDRVFLLTAHDASSHEFKLRSVGESG